MKNALPLFLQDDLNRLQQRRNALLKRLQSKPKHSPGRYELIGQLKAVTSDVMRLQNEIDSEIGGRR